MDGDVVQGRHDHECRIDTGRDRYDRLLAIGWPQSAGVDHGATAREILDRSHVPVLLVAIDSAETS